MRPPAALLPALAAEVGLEVGWAGLGVEVEAPGVEVLEVPVVVAVAEDDFVEATLAELLAGVLFDGGRGGARVSSMSKLHCCGRGRD